MEHWKVLSVSMVDRHEKCLNSRRSRMAKTVTFWPWWQPFDSFCFETLSFSTFSPFSLFATQKSRGTIAPRPPPGVAGPELKNATGNFNLLFAGPKLVQSGFKEPSSTIVWKYHALAYWRTFSYVKDKDTPELSFLPLNQSSGLS